MVRGLTGMAKYGHAWDIVNGKLYRKRLHARHKQIKIILEIQILITKAKSHCHRTWSSSKLS
jgi:hypothetical protein